MQKEKTSKSAFDRNDCIEIPWPTLTIKMSTALPINRNMFIDRRKSVSPSFPKRQVDAKKVEQRNQKAEQLAKRRQSTPQASLQNVLFGQALFKISDTVRDLCTGIPVDPLPKAAPTRSKAVQHAPKRLLEITPEQEKVFSTIFIS